MSILLTVIAVIVIFSALVLIHEYGHFIAARRAGIKVLEFGIGFPPRLFKKKIGETLYTINAIPFGGFVKLYGEDATDSLILKDKRSFAHKSAWVRTKVICAGVFMNFVLAIVLLTVGFSFGIEPLLVTQEDLMSHLEQGNIITSPGLYVSAVSDKARAAGIASGDQILFLNDKALTHPSQAAVFQKGNAKTDVDLAIKSGQTLKRVHVPVDTDKKHLGIDLKPFTDFQRLTVLELKPSSNAAAAGMRPGDIIVLANGEQVYVDSDLRRIMTESPSVAFTVLRGSELITFTVSVPDTRRVVIAEVFADSLAAKIGMHSGDVLLAIDVENVVSPFQVQDRIRNAKGASLQYRVLRDGQQFTFPAAVEPGGQLGIALSFIDSFRNDEFSTYRSGVLTSITEIKKVRYGPWKAFKQAISESVRMTGLTVQAFGRTIASIVSRFTVPGDIGGPVQIAYYTHTFIKEGFFAVLRFMALLSLSLAVINVLPIPALDGGRLLFIVIEVVFKRRVNARIESVVHATGFILLLFLIGLVTYSDIVKLF